MGDEIMMQAGCILGERQSHRHLDRAFPSSLDALTVTDPSLYRGSVVSHPKFLPTAQPRTCSPISRSSQPQCYLTTSSLLGPQCPLPTQSPPRARGYFLPDLFSRIFKSHYMQQKASF